MINVLEQKGILTGKEVLDEMEVVVAAKRKKEANCRVQGLWSLGGWGIDQVWF